MKRLVRSRNALSPVIAAIILVAATVAVSIAAAAWMGAITFSFMKTEQVTFTNFVWGASNANVQVTLKNSGSSDLSIQAIRINGVSPASASPSLATPYLLPKGSSVTFTLTRTGGFNSGTSYEFVVVTSKGNLFGPYSRTAP